jgi:HEAT repeat protein
MTRKATTNSNITPSPTPAGEAILHLASQGPLLNAKLVELSGIDRTHLEQFEEQWPGILLERRRQIIIRLVELTEDNIELNFDSIFKFCFQDIDDEVRVQAIEGLWENEETSLIEPLIALLKDSSEKVQAAAALALGKFALLAEHGKIRAAYKTKIQLALLSVFNDKNRAIEARRRALEAASPLSLPEIREAISKAYNSQEPLLKISSVYAMGKSLDSEWLPLIFKELASKEPELRFEACNACSELEEETAVPDLIKLTNDSDSDVRMAAIQALGKIGTAQAKLCLKHCAESDNEAIRLTAEQALSELEGKENPLTFRM